MSISQNTSKVNELIQKINALPKLGENDPVAPALQVKEVTPSKDSQTVMPDDGFDALQSVFVYPIPDEFVDTSDANAVAKDMAEGKIAYVNGQKVIGSVADYDEQTGWTNRTPTKSGSNVKLAVSPGVPYLFRNGFYLSSPLSNFGNATAADVAKGKTFTSSAGLKVAGTLESQGGLPSGVSVLACGTYTPTEDATSRVDVSHGLSVKPNFSIIMMDDDLSNDVLASALVGAAVFYKKTKYTSTSTIVYSAHILMEGYDSTSKSGGSGSRAASDAYFTETTFGIPCNTTYKLKAGKTYHWVCGLLDSPK